MSFNAKQELVLGRQLKVQELCIPLVITGNATPASVVLATDEPSLLFLKTQGVDKITAALDAGEAAPTFVAQNDANGLFSAMIKIGEQIDKVICAQIIRRDEHGVDTGKLANTTGITANGDKIVFDCDTGKDLSLANLNACLIVRYTTKK